MKVYIIQGDRVTQTAYVTTRLAEKELAKRGKNARPAHIVALEVVVEEES